MATRLNSRAQERKPLSDFVLRKLRREILDGVIKPGERIRQEAIARQCRTSRIPVREALKQLETEGLVTLRSHVGARAARLDLAELDEIYLIRERLEPFAIALSTPNLTEGDHEALRRYVEQMEVVANIDNPSEWIELDRKFHLTTYSGSGLPRLLSVIESLWNGTQQYRRAYVRLPTRLKVAHDEHRFLLDAIVRRDADEAERLSLAHIKRTRLELDQHAELFAS